MSYDDKFKAKVKAEYEAGLDRKVDICKRYKIPRKTLVEWATKGGWEWQKSNEKVLEKVTKSAAKKLEVEYSDRIEDFTKEHIKAMDNVGALTRSTLNRLGQEVTKSKNKMDKAEADSIFAQAKILKISSETLSIIYADKRKALGLDKPKEDPAKTDLEERIRLSMERDGFK